MKKTLLITTGVVVILVVILVWVYLFMFGAPKSADDVFSNFGFNSGATSEFPPLEEQPSIVDTSPVTEGGAPQALRQLTTRPVAGAVFISGGIRYVERGTGYIYDIMFSTGTESLVSGTTLPRTVDAIFSEDGNRVAITSETGGGENIALGTLVSNTEGEGTLDVINLPLGAREVGFTSTNTLSYIESTESGSGGVVYDLLKGTRTTVFNVPLRDIEVLWGDKTYMYTTPSEAQVGYIYTVNKGLQYVQRGERGLMGIAYGDGVITTHVDDGRFISIAHQSSSTYNLPVSLFPEKCVVNPVLNNYLYCAAPETMLVGAYPDSWYKGAVSLQDSLWSLDIENESTVILSNFLTESGREIDVSHIGVSADGVLLYLINKNDGTLWVFDTSVPRTTL